MSFSFTTCDQANFYAVIFSYYQAKIEWIRMRNNSPDRWLFPSWSVSRVCQGTWILGKRNKHHSYWSTDTDKFIQCLILKVKTSLESMWADWTCYHFLTLIGISSSYLIKLVNLSNEEISIPPFNFCISNVYHILKWKQICIRGLWYFVSFASAFNGHDTLHRHSVQLNNL